MLDALRRGASGWVAKFLLTILIISFAVWGVADVFRGFGAGTLARVGDVEISPDEFQTAYRNQLDMLGQFGRRLTPEQARTFGLDMRALSGLIDTAAVDSHARRLNLAVSDETVAQQIAREPSFRTSDGKFNKEAFQSFLTQVRLTEQGFLAQRRKDEVREQLTGAIASGVSVPEASVIAAYNWREEKRKLEFVTIPESAVKVADPDEAQLKEIYEQSKRQFVVPESRKLSVLLLEQAEVKSRVSISDDEIKGYFDTNRATLDVPERRRIHQISFKDKAAAEAARKAIEGGKSFLMVALETEGLAGRLPGLLARADIGDLKFAEVAFSLAKDKVSEIVQGAGGPMLVMVSEIAPGKARTLDEVKDEIRDKLSEQKIAAELNSLHDAVDNGRASRKPLADIAASLKLKHAEFVSERGNKTADGKPALVHADAEEIVEHGFQGATGAESEPLELKAGGFAWVDVLATTPEQEKPLETVKEDVKALFLDTTRRKLLSDLAAKSIERLAKGEPFSAVAKDVGGKVEASEPITRSTTPQGLSSAAVQLAFTTARGSAASAESADRKSRTIVRVAEIAQASAPTKEQMDRIRGELARQLQGDALQAYASALRDQFGVRINDTALKRLTGSDRQP